MGNKIFREGTRTLLDCLLDGKVKDERFVHSDNKTYIIRDIYEVGEGVIGVVIEWYHEDGKFSRKYSKWDKGYQPLSWFIEDKIAVEGD